MDANSDEGRKRLNAALESILEFYDSCQLFVTRYDDETGKTLAAESGKGNYYARYGQVKEWVEEQDETTREHIRDHEDD